jgi:MoxR-like ATPase
MAEILKPQSRRYTGKIQPEPGQKNAKTGQVLQPYLPHDQLVEVVNLAMDLERPLLLKGEPGCGKTRLADAVSFELEMPLITWYIKSTTKAREGLYSFDALRRLRDAQVAAAYQGQEDKIQRIENLDNYIQLEQLGKAFDAEERTVVLIDEIDKADIDFPNDLLLELDEQRFQILETGRWVTSRHPPIVLITSNDEKDLPDAFLRRCLFYYIDFPTPDKLKEIVQKRYPRPEDTSDEEDNQRQELISSAVTRFNILRKKMVEDKKDSGKKVSTSELLDWVKVLLPYPKALEELTSSTKLPFPYVLLKDRGDLVRYAPQFAQRMAGV